MTWVVLQRHPPPGDFFSLFLFWPHLACALALGLVLGRVKVRLASLLVSLASAAVIATVFGGLALGIYVAQAVAVYAIVTATLGRSAWVAAVATASALAAGLCACWLVRYNLAPIGLWVYGLLRHVSFAVDVRRGAPPTWSGFALYNLYYPALLQTEQYADFTQKNLVETYRPEYARAAKRLALGWLRVTVALMLPYSFDDVLVVTNFASAWATALVVYLRAVLFITGVFDGVQAVSSLHGLRIRENFPGVLLAETPSMFWRRWRATMTDFFITYVYVPLGGRERRDRNVAIVFTCSVLWHWIGVPFFGGRSFYPHYLPVLVFGLWNIAIMTLSWRIWRPVAEREGEGRETIGYREVRILLAALFGTGTVVFLSYTPANSHHLLDNLSVLFPLRALLNR